LNFCTIIARNYLPFARVLTESLHRFHPGAEVTVLALDDMRAEVALAGDRFRLLELEELDLGPGELERMRVLYDVMELATAVKPWLLRHLLAEDRGPVVYLDPDIEAFAPLDEIDRLARRHQLVLTPHTLGPVPRDGHRLTEADIMGSGIYNLGFAALGEDAGEVVDWWCERLRRDCISEPREMLFVDQRWMDFAPALFTCHILRDSSYNVAYWNLADRDVAWTGDGYEVDGRPLRFFHFSGYDPAQPWRLSKHQQDDPRILLSERPGVARLCHDYAEHLREAGWGTLARTPYRWDVLDNGIPLDRRLRRLYRRELKAAEAAHRPLPPNPFERGGTEAFVDWLNEPLGYGPRRKISRYLQFVHDDWDVLQKTFPDLAGPDGERYLDWAAGVGAEHALIPAQLLPRRRHGDREPATAEPPLLRGVNVAGYLRSDGGLGVSARALATAVEEAGIPLATMTHGGTPGAQDHDFRERGDGGNPYDVNLVCVNADMMPSFAWDVSQEFFRGRYTIGFWAWETGELPPSMRKGLEYVQEVWTPSEFASAAVRKATDKPVLTMPHPVPAPTRPSARALTDVDLPDGFKFLFVLDFFSTIERKNPEGLIQAFSRAFAPGEGPQLVIKTINGARRRLDLERLRYAAQDRPDIHILDGYLDDAEQAALLAACDCYVSLHRSEGFGLTIAEAMAAGKPVIATGYSGNLDYMTPGNSRLCSFSMVKVGPSQVYPADSTWAEPDLDHAARLMREVFEAPDEAAKLGAQARSDMAEKYSAAALAARVQRRIAEIHAGPAPRSEQAAPSATTAAAREIDAGPRADLPTRRGGPYGAAARLFRRGVLRSLAQYHEYQHRVGHAILEAIDTNSSAHRELKAAHRVEEERRARLEAEIRQLRDQARRVQSRIDAVESSLDRAAERVSQIDPVVDHPVVDGARAPIQAPRE
jgi:glycosyltransferase involved in cell wall biosynthesis